MKLKIENERIRIIQDGNVNEKSINIYEIEFEFSEEWDELTKKLMISKGSQTQEIEIIDNRVIIPCLEKGTYYLGVVGYILEEDIFIKRKATNIIRKNISISSAGFEANTEYQEEYASVLDEKISELQEIVEESDIIFEVKEMLDNGELKGDKGDTGDPGQDGEDGKSAYEVWLDEGNVGTEQDFLESLKGENGIDGHDGVDGQDGQDGHTPIKGTDYWTTQDKQEIVTDVETDLQPTISAIQNTADTAERIARGANQSLSFSNYQAMITAFNSLANNVYSTGQNVMIITLNVPDLWISSIESTGQTYTYTTDEAFTTALETNGYVQVGYYRLSALETQKVDLTNYYTKTQTDTLLNAKVDKSSFVYDSNTETLSITIS